MHNICAYKYLHEYIYTTHQKICMVDVHCCHKYLHEYIYITFQINPDKEQVVDVSFIKNQIIGPWVGVLYKCGLKVNHEVVCVAWSERCPHGGSSLLQVNVGIKDEGIMC